MRIIKNFNQRTKTFITKKKKKKKKKKRRKVQNKLNVIQFNIIHYDIYNNI